LDKIGVILSDGELNFGKRVTSLLTNRASHLWLALFIEIAKQGTKMLISNIEIVPGKRIVKHLGMVQGNTVRAKHAGRDIMAGFKNIFGGELKGYTELLNEAREEAMQRMTEQANAVGANAVINVRFSTSSITAGAAELFAYGTAVILE
jgi:uncharacterized protein YbjQ (UPF0145 family)